MKIDFNKSTKIELSTDFHDSQNSERKNNIKFNLWSPISLCLAWKHHQTLMLHYKAHFVLQTLF